MRSLLFAGVGAVALALAPAAFAQTLDFSVGGGSSKASEASTSNVHGTGSNMSGGMVDAFSNETDMSASQIGPHGVAQTGTTGQNESGVSEMTFDVGSGHDSGTATGSGSASSFNFGASLLAPHHH